MKPKAYVRKETSNYMRYLFQDKGLRGNELLKRFPKYSKAKIYRHAKRPMDKVTTFDKRKHNKGRPRKLSIREERSIMRHLPTTYGFVSRKSFSTVPVQQLNGFYKTGIQFKTVLQQDVLSKRSEQ